MIWFICMIHNDENPNHISYYKEKWFSVGVEDGENLKEKIMELLTSIRIPCCYGEMTDKEQVVSEFWTDFIRTICYKDCGCDICGIPKSIIETLTIYPLEQGLEKLRLKT